MSEEPCSVLILHHSQDANVISPLLDKRDKNSSASGEKKIVGMEHFAKKWKSGDQKFIQITVLA